LTDTQQRTPSQVADDQDRLDGIGRLDRPRRLVLPLLLKIVFLGIVVALAFALTPALVGAHQWAFLVVIWLIAGVLVATYATGRGLPAKYLVPGVLLLTLFVVYPIGLTFKTSLTNFGDGARVSKETTVASIVGSSVVQTPNAPRYNLTVGTTGSPAAGPYTFFLVDQASNKAYAGTTGGLEPLPSGATVTGGFVKAVPGYTILTPIQINNANAKISKVTVPTAHGAIRSLGINQAFEGTTVLVYDKSADTITNTQTHDVYRVTRQGNRDFFVDAQGHRVSDQSWKAYVGLANYKQVVTDHTISRDFLRIFLWTLVFALVSVGSTFVLGLLLAVTFNDPRVRGQKIYRALLILPYAVPGFIALLVWAGFFNRDFGLINQLTGLHVNWLGNPTTAKFAVLLTNLWMGFPYMFLVCTGALQAIPSDLREAARIDGASGWAGFTKITFPLLLVSVAPLLVAAFAFNFNNYNAIALLTKGGPFPPDNPNAGGTDILISYTMRLAFGASGAEIGFASAVSVLLFLITGIIAAGQFRATRSLEEVL
jgi:arabinogalactan oligomer/maltooligosaccharide transport system permease protein